jgi:hypothetical protein
MVLYRNGFRLYEQEELARRFGVKIGPDEHEAFCTDMPVRERLNCDEGVSTMDSVDDFNTFFTDEGIPLKATRHMYSDIHSLQDFLSDQLGHDKEVWVEYHSQEIHDSEHIHDGLVESIDLASQSAVIIDPVPRRKQRVTVPIAMLGRAISTQFGKELGMITISKTSA